jgi:hypothetical protein
VRDIDVPIRMVLFLWHYSLRIDTLGVEVPFARYSGRPRTAADRHSVPNPESG